MKTNRFAPFRTFWLGLILLCFSLPLRADQFGLFTYQVVEGVTVEITRYPPNAVGSVDIPAVIDGKPVTSIGIYAFNFCRGLTSLTIPSSVATIGEYAFSYCSGLASVTIPPSVTTIGEGAFYNSGLTSVTIPSSLTIISDLAFNECRELTSVTIPSSVTIIGGHAFKLCTGLTSVTIPTGVTSIGAGAFGGCTGLTSVTIPSSVTSIGGHFIDGTWGYDGAFSRCNGLTSVTLQQGLATIGSGMFARCTALASVPIPSSVTSIGEYAFSGCSGLTSVTIPSSVTSIGGYAFYGCTGLTKALFLGHAPGQMGGELFFDPAPGFTIYYLSSRSGFTSPTWNDYPTTMINEVTYPAASWLLAHGLWYDTDLHHDPDGDGVSLLMAYALDFDPRLNLQGSLPVPVRNGNTLSLSFHATSQGVTYRAETSTDLTTWTTTGVTQSAPGTDGHSTATVSLNTPRRFLRLVVED